MHSLAERVLYHIRQQQLLHAGDRVGVAVSGGIDSVALLRLLLELRNELGIVLSVVHFNHKLRGPESDADQEFVAKLAREHDLDFLVDGDDVAQLAAEEHISVETAARELRYGFFRYLIGEDSGPQGLKLDSRNRTEPGPERPLFHEGLYGHGNPHGQAEGMSSPDSDVRAAAVESEAAAAPEGRDGKARHPPTSLPAGSCAGKAEAEEIESRQGRQSDPQPPIARLDKVLTGHTLDDQAETVLMRLIRGSGLRGLGGIHPRIAIEDEDGEAGGEIVRPLLSTRRSELEQYLKDIGQPWREDSTNADHSFTRNRVRKLVVPLLEREFNPAVAENLSELAEIARGEEDYWENEVAGWMGTAVHWTTPPWAESVSGEDRLVQIAVSGGATARSHAKNDLRWRMDSAPWLVMNASVDRLWFLSEPVAGQRRLIKAIGERVRIPLEFRHVEEILRFASEDADRGKELSLPLGWRVMREPQELVFLTPDLRKAESPGDYEYPLLAPGQRVVPEASVVFEVQRISVEATAGYNPDYLLDAVSLTGPLRVRNWRPGDRFWPAHTKSPKKIKELLQERHITGPARHSWPVVVSADQIVWLRGFPAPAKFRAKPGREAILIREEPLDQNTVM